MQRAAHARERLWSIGEVVAFLQQRFPKVTVSKLRFWERQGLIHPRRTAGGHRLYCPADVQRLSVILQLRMQHRLPLPVVRKILQYLETHPEAEPLLIELFIRTTGRTEPRAQPVQEVLRELDLSEDMLRDLIRRGLIIPCSATGQLAPEDIAILQVIREITSISPLRLDDLEVYVRTARQLAEHEMAFLDRVPAAPQVPSSGPVHRRLHELLDTLFRILHLRYLQHLTVERMMTSDTKPASDDSARVNPAVGK